MLRPSLPCSCSVGVFFISAWGFINFCVFIFSWKAFVLPFRGGSSLTRLSRKGSHGHSSMILFVFSRPPPFPSFSGPPPHGHTKHDRTNHRAPKKHIKTPLEASLSTTEAPTNYPTEPPKNAVSWYCAHGGPQDPPRGPTKHHRTPHKPHRPSKKSSICTHSCMQ